MHYRLKCPSVEKYKSSFIDIIKVTDAYGEIATLSYIAPRAIATPNSSEPPLLREL